MQKCTKVQSRPFGLRFGFRGREWTRDPSFLHLYAGLQSTRAGKPRVAYPTSKRLLIHICALRTLKTAWKAMGYCNQEVPYTPNLWLSQSLLIVAHAGLRPWSCCGPRESGAGLHFMTFVVYGYVALVSDATRPEANALRCRNASIQASWGPYKFRGI